MSVSTRSSSNKKLIDEDFKNELSNLIKDELISAMNSTEMRKAIASQVKELIQSDVASFIQPLETKLAGVKIENEKLRADLFDMKVHVTNLSLHANANEQYSRKYNVRFGGIHEVEGEDCYAAVSGFFKQELRVDIKDSDIDRAHRVGRKGYAPRQMIIKFKSYHAKLVVMKNSRKLKDKRGMFVNDDLTKYNLDLIRNARFAEHVASAWSNDRKIFVKLADSSTHVVRSPDDVRMLGPDK